MLLPPIPAAVLCILSIWKVVPPHPPSAEHLLGTDSSARDVFARLLYGFRICMLFSLILVGNLYGVWNFNWRSTGIFWRVARYRNATDD